MSMWQERQRQERITPVWKGVKETLIGRQYGENNEEWLKDFFNKHPVLTFQEKRAFVATQFVYDKLAVKFRGDLEISLAFSQAKLALQEKLDSLKNQQTEPIDLVTFLELYKVEIQTQLTEYADNHREEWGIIEETVGKFPDLTAQKDPRTAWNFMRGFVEVFGRNPRFASLVPLLLVALFVATLSTACVTPSQDGLTAGGGAVPAVIAPENPLDKLLNPDAVVSAGTPIVEIVTPTPTNTPIPPTPPPTDTPFPTETSIISPTAEITMTGTLTPTAVVTNTVEATATTTETQVVPYAIAKGVSNLRSGPGTNYAIAGGLKAGERMDVIGKNFDGSWLEVETTNGKTAWVKTTLVTATGLTDVEVVKTPEPPKPAPTATHNPEAATGLGTVTNTTDNPKKGFFQPNGDKNGEVLPIGATASVIAQQPDWIKIKYNGKEFWILSNNLSVIKPGGTTEKTTTPTTAPVIEAGVNTSSYFDAKKFTTPNFPFALPIDLSDLSQAGKRGYLSEYGSTNCNVINRVYENNGNLAKEPGPNLSFELGKVVSAVSTGNGTLAVTVTRPDGSTQIINTNPNVKIYLATLDDWGSYVCIDPGMIGLQASYLPQNSTFGWNSGGYLLTYTRSG